MENNSKLKKGSTSNKQKNYKEELPEDYSIYLAECNIRLDQTNYYRGISYNTLDRFNVGYDPNWKHPKNEENTYIQATPRLIIPTSNYSYLARDTRKPEDIPEEQQEYKKSKVGKTHIFNVNAIKTAQKPIFVVEGELDALSIIDVNGEAIGLGSTSMINQFVKYLEEEGNRPAHTLIVALDHDGTGEKETIHLIKELERLKIPFTIAEPYKNFKDANEALMIDREGFSVYVAKWEAYEKEQYIKQNATSSFIENFLDGVKESANTTAIKTGFNKLDNKLGGGLYEGLYTIGAISSLGKTTFIMQIASEIAKSGQDVLIFSLEMARNELMAKMISRHTAQLALEQDLSIETYAKTTRQITVGAFYKYYTPSQKEHINKSVEELGKYAEHIYIKEGIGDIGVKNVMTAIEKHKKALNTSPVVVIDYLQLLAPYNDRWSEKQNTDKTIMELKRISRDYKTPVIVISSFNRANYQSEAKEEAFKESGGIEYSTDVLLGLQFKGAGETGFKLGEARKKKPREIELSIIKNRNGEAGEKIEYKYYPKYNYFIEQ